MIVHNRKQFLVVMSVIIITSAITGLDALVSETTCSVLIGPDLLLLKLSTLVIFSAVWLGFKYAEKKRPHITS